MRFFYEVQFAIKEVIEINELRVAFDDRIRLLLKRQSNVQTETSLASGTALRCAHDPIAAAGDDHVILCHHRAREVLRRFCFRRIDRDPSRAEHDHFAELRVLPEDLRRITHFFERAIDQLEIRHAHLVARHFQRGHDHLLN